ncbi:MAG: hypothetical protein J5702_05090 [Bacteroidales bacterium]|nr:hypothetical protein [Bacteroidales bacterium]
MKNFIWILALAVALTAGCKGDKTPTDPNPAQPEAPEAPATPDTPATASVRMEDFPFDELYQVFSIFGSNIMTDFFASPQAKEKIKDELRDSYNGSREYQGNANNVLSYSYNNEGIYDGFLMGCWKYDADGHYLVLLDEEGGVDATGTKYIRAYDYDPATQQAHEVELPLSPQPKAEDFDDVIRLAGCMDIPEIRRTMRDHIYNYAFSPEGVTVELNVTDDWEAAGNCGFESFYRWNGSEFVRDESVPSPCIHDEGFAMIKLRERMPAMNFDSDPLDYDIRYSDEGALWLVDREGARVLEVQMEGDDVGSVEVFDPRYSVQQSSYWRSKNRLCVGSRINEFVDFADDPIPEVVLYSDGTVDISFKRYNSVVSLRTTSADLEGQLPKIPSTEVKTVVKDPKFKPAATVKSILVQAVYAD